MESYGVETENSAAADLALSKDEFWQRWLQFSTAGDLKHPKIPVMGHKELDIYQLYREVLQYGGYNEGALVQTQSHTFSRLQSVAPRYFIRFPDTDAPKIYFCIEKMQNFADFLVHEGQTGTDWAAPFLGTAARCVAIRHVGSWSKIWKILPNFDPSITDSSYRLRRNYEKYLLDFEMRHSANSLRNEVGLFVGIPERSIFGLDTPILTRKRARMLKESQSTARTVSLGSLQLTLSTQSAGTVACSETSASGFTMSVDSSENTSDAEAEESSSSDSQYTPNSTPSKSPNHQKAALSPIKNNSPTTRIAKACGAAPKIKRFNLDGAINFDLEMTQEAPLSRVTSIPTEGIHQSLPRAVTPIPSGAMRQCLPRALTPKPSDLMKHSLPKLPNTQEQTQPQSEQEQQLVTCPILFHSRRVMVSLRNQSEITTYDCIIINTPLGYHYVVTPDDDPARPIHGDSAEDCYDYLMGCIRDNCLRQLLHASVGPTGEQFFGLEMIGGAPRPTMELIQVAEPFVPEPLPAVPKQAFMSSWRTDKSIPSAAASRKTAVPAPPQLEAVPAETPSHQRKRAKRKRSTYALTPTKPSKLNVPPPSKRCKVAEISDEDEELAASVLLRFIRE